MLTFVFTVLGIACGLVCQGVYVYGMVRKTVKPHLFTWLVWSITMGIAGAAQWSSAGGLASFVILSGSLGCGGIAVASLWCGHPEHTRDDWLLLALALATIPLWLLTKNPLGAVLLATAIDLFGYGPTFRKSWRSPGEESVSAYFIGALGLLFSACALDTRSLVTLCYPVAIVVANVSLILFLDWRRKALQVPAALPLAP